ncbi:MAG: hypothetical protein M3323_13325 [Actinomycetota bacterium]|nr:hypothetical protein [Actinomycetota bacterium]
MRGVRNIAVTAALMAAILVPARPAAAVFHLSMIREVFGGSAEQPNAQFVEIQMYTGNQNFVVGERVVVYDSAGTEAGSFVFTSHVPNGEDQSYILVATPEAEALFDVAADLEMTPVIVRSGGKVCFGNSDPPVDCASWGGYSGDDSDTGTPFNAPVGLLPGQSMERKISGGEDGERLDAEDDTDDSAADFQMAAPSPTGNAGTPGGEANEHARSVSLALRGSLVARGRVSAEDDFEGCVDDVPVVVQRRRDGRWRPVKRTTTNGTGRYRVGLRDRPGTYRAVAPELEPSETHRCLEARSRARTYR